MSKAQLGAGNVEIELAGETVTLRPSLKAAQAISRLDGGIVGAIERAARFDIDLITACVAHGVGQSVKEVEEAVFTTGLTVLAPPVMEFLSRLANGGRPSAKGNAAENPQ